MSHLEDPLILWNEPTLHLMHADEFGLLTYLPAAHIMHVEEPSSAWYVPTGHSSHSVWPSTEVKKPEGHPTQDVGEELLLPAGQGVHALAESKLKDPTSQSTQAVAPDQFVYCPVPQGLHSSVWPTESKSLNLPSGQGEHSMYR